MKRKLISRILAVSVASVLLFVSACEPDVPDPGPGGGDDPVVVPTGTLEVEFRVPTSFLPPNRVFRADLSIAKDAESLYQGNFSHVANVYNSKLVYQFKLEPGYYYFKAGIICIAFGDSCSAAGFPGGQNGMKWAIGTATIYEGETVHVVPQFTQ